MSEGTTNNSADPGEEVVTLPITDLDKITKAQMLEVAQKLGMDAVGLKQMNKPTLAKFINQYAVVKQEGDPDLPSDIQFGESFEPHPDADKIGLRERIHEIDGHPTKAGTSPTGINLMDISSHVETKLELQPFLTEREAEAVIDQIGVQDWRQYTRAKKLCYTFVAKRHLHPGLPNHTYDRRLLLTPEVFHSLKNRERVKEVSPK